MARRTFTHAVADVVFTDEESSMFCQCGWDASDVTPEDLRDKHQDHRESVGERRRGYSEMIGNEDNEFNRDQRSGRSIRRKAA